MAVKNKKKFIIAAVGILIVSGIVILAVKKSGRKQVPVYSVMDLNFGYGGFDYDSMIYGTVTSEANQEIKYNTNQKVEEIYVINGQRVSKGDKLLSYDLTSADIELQMKRLDKEGLDIQIQKLRREIYNLKTTNPEPNVPDIPLEPDIPVEPEKPIEPDIPKDPVPAQEVLDEHSIPYMGKGTSDNPFHYIVSQKGTITGKFLNKLATEKQLFVIEVRQGDVSTGEIIKFYGQKMSEQDAVEDENTTYNLGLALKEKVEEEKDIPAYDILNKDSIEKEGWISGKGTKESPYVFLVKDTGIVKGEFFNLMKEKEAFFRLEVREEDRNDGIVIKAWNQNGKYIKDIKDEDEFLVDVKVNKSKENSKQEDLSDDESTKEDKNKENSKAEESTKEDKDKENSNTEESIKEDKEKENPTKEDASKEPANAVKSKKRNVNVVNTSKVDYVMGMNKSYIVSDIKSQIAQLESQIKELQLNEKEAEIEIRKMERKLENQTIVSDVNGVVTNLGDPDNPPADGSPLMTVKSEEGLYIKGEVPENKLHLIGKGTILEGFSGQSGMTFTAEVTNVSPYPSGERDKLDGIISNSNYPFTAYIENGSGLSNDDYIELKIAKDDIAMSKIELNQPFVKFEDGRYFVMIADENNRLKKQYIKVTGTSFFVTIEGGLSPEDRIAFPYGKNVKEGAPVKDSTVDELYDGY